MAGSRPPIRAKHSSLRTLEAAMRSIGHRSGGAKRRNGIMNEQSIQMGPMWILAGLSAAWLAQNFMYRRGYGLIVDISLGVGASVVGGGILLALAGLPAGMFVVFVVGFAMATGVISVQRVCWPFEPAVWE